MNNKIKPALIGGLVAGVLSVIPFVNFCACLWSIGGGFLAGYLFIKDSAEPVSLGNGAVTGLLAGAVAGLLRLVIGIPLALAMTSMSSVTEDQLRRLGVQLSISALIIVAGIFGALITAGVSTLGGLIAVPIFEKRKNGEAPPPPPVGFAA